MTTLYATATVNLGIGGLALAAVLLVLAVLALQLRRGHQARRLLERRVAELSALSEAGRAIVTAELDVDELCTLIYRQASQIVDTWIFQLGLFEGDHYRIKVWVVRGEQQPETIFDLNEGEGIVGWMRRTGKPLLVRDFEAEMDTLPVRPRYVSDHPPRSAVFVPLIVGETVIGAMVIQSDQPAAFTDDHQRVLSIIANQAAAAITNARLYRAERRRRQIADRLRQVSILVNSSLETDEVLRSILEGVAHLATFDSAAILLLDNKHTLSLKAARGAPSVVEAVGQSWPIADERRLRHLTEIRQPKIFSSGDDLGVYHQLLDFPPDHSCLGIPIVIRDELIGLLVLDCRKPDQYGVEDAALIAAVASQAASALENARLYAAGQEEAWISTALLEVAEATSLAKSVDEVLETVVRITPLLIGVDRCAILLWNEDVGACEVAAAYEPAEDQSDLQVGQMFPLGEWPLLDQLWETGSPAVDEFGGIPGAPTTLDVEITLLGLPLRAQGALTGAMVIGYTGLVSFTDHRIKLIAGIANQAALAIESAQLVIAQQEEAWVSLALLQVAEAVANLAELDDVLNVVTRLTPLLVGVDSCLVYLWDVEQLAFVPGAAHGLSQEHLLQFQSTPISATTWPQILQTAPVQTPPESSEHVLDEREQAGVVQPGGVTGEPRERGTQTSLVPGPPHPIAGVLGLQSPFALPLLVWGEMMGALVVDTLDGASSFTGRRLNILAGVAQQTATAIQNARLQIESVERQKLERELQLARQIQLSFLPAEVPQVPGWDLAAHWQGARQVSGDFYDFIPLGHQTPPPRFWGFVMADVADKGMPAALFMALSRTLVRTMAIGRYHPAEVLTQANDMIMANSRSGLFVTLFYAILDPKQGVLSYANAGHNPPLHFRAASDEVVSMDAQGIAMGVVTDIQLEQKQAQMEPGDVLLMYTDGVTDALNSEMEEFDLQRLQRAVEESRSGTAADIVRAIDQAVTEFVGDMAQFDDLTLVVLKRQAAPS